MNPTAISHYAGPIAITGAYFLMWYCLLFVLQSGTKYRLISKYKMQGKEFDRYFGNDPKMLAADRAVINTQEQMLPFLAALWLHAAFVSPSVATWLGGAYVILRSIYPILLGRQLSNTQPKRVFMVTLPCYLIVFYMLGSTVVAAFS